MRHLQPFKAHRGLQQALPPRCSMREKLSSSKRPAHPHTHGRIGAASSRICRHSYSAPTEGRRSARWYHLVSKRRPPPHCHYDTCVHTGRHSSHIHVQWHTDDHCSTPRRRGGDCADRGQRRYGGSLRQRKILGACCARSSGLAQQCQAHRWFHRQQMSINDLCLLPNIVPN